MNLPLFSTQEVEIETLSLEYVDLRLRNEKMIQSMSCSLEKNGQLSPVISLSSGDENETTRAPLLLDGYVRVKALQRLGRDTVQSIDWKGTEVHGLLTLLNQQDNRNWLAIEQARVISVLHQEYGLSQSEIARQLGRDKSWVSRRLSLYQETPEPILKALYKGNISLWTATRVLIPLARANFAHSTQLLGYLEKHHQSTRATKYFLERYTETNQQTRQKMITHPEHFFKAYTENQKEKAALKLSRGPEGEWCQGWKTIGGILQRLRKLVDVLFHPRQGYEEYEKLSEPFLQAKQKIAPIEEHILREKNDLDLEA